MALFFTFEKCCAILLLLLSDHCSAFSPPSTQAKASFATRFMSVNGDDSPATSSNSLAISSSEDKTQLFSAFAALSLPDQYDAVLTGLCAKLLDDGNTKGSNNNNLDKQALQDPMQLVQEMNEKNIPASPRSLMALVDVSI